MIFLVNLGNIYGHFTAPSGTIFWDFTSFIDTNSYIAWEKQAADGNILFKDAYTSEQHPRALFNPLFLFLGMASRLTSIPLRLIDHLGRIFSEALLLFALYMFISYFIKDRIEKVLTFLITVTSGGFGWLWFFPSIRAVKDSWRLAFSGDTSTFLALNSYMIHSFSWALLLLTFYFFLKALDEDKVSLAALSGLTALVLLFTHFYETLIVYPVLVIYIAAKYFISGCAHPRRIFPA